MRRSALSPRALRKIITFLTVFTLSNMMLFSAFMPTKVQAEGSVLGIHILHPYEIEDAKELLTQGQSSEEWHYVTIPLSLDDLGKQQEWQEFFNQARQQKVIPLVRLATKAEGDTWKIPNRQEIVQQIAFLSRLEWPTDKRHIIVFNEVNHAKEWGGQLDPQSYAEILAFTSNWARSEDKNYVILPAAMDLAAPNGKVTMEAFTYLNKMHESDPDIFGYADYWNSHSYPNPGFSSSPKRVAQNSLRGFEFELKYLKDKTGKDYQVFITETGWEVNAATRNVLTSYYQYAMKNIWSNPQVVAVTPFLLRGDPGPFKGFTFLDKNNQPTVQYKALQKALTQNQQLSAKQP